MSLDSQEDPRREYWTRELKLSRRQALRHLTRPILDQVDRCKSVEAQRLLIRGIKGESRR